MYVGDDLDAVIESLVSGKSCGDSQKQYVSVGASVLPPIPLDHSDRNRTSPFAFTGNKFEFRMPGSSFNIACTNIMLNTAVAESLRVFADELEGASDLEAALTALVRRELAAHRRIIFNGNGYSKEWEEEAARRGLLNLRSTPDALPLYTSEKNVSLFTRHGVYTLEEMKSREEIGLEEYNKTIHIEAETMLRMISRQILPACLDYSGKLASSAAVKAGLGIDAATEKALVSEISAKSSELAAAQSLLQTKTDGVPEDVHEAAAYYHAEVIPVMEKARTAADSLELLVGKESWPFPVYEDILFYV